MKTNHTDDENQIADERNDEARTTCVYCGTCGTALPVRLERTPLSPPQIVPSVIACSACGGVAYAIPRQGGTP